VRSDAGPLARLRRLHLRRTVKAVLDAFSEHDLLTYASAISFQTFFALIPLTLTALGLLGAFSLENVWNDELAPDLRPEVSGAVFEVIDSTVRKIFANRQLFWATLGALLTLWEVSGAMRAVMTVLNRIYRTDRERSWIKRYGVSFALSAVTIVAVLLAGLILVAGRAIDGFVVGVLRWPLAAVPLLLALAAVVHWAPSEQRPLRWVTYGTALVVVAWLGMTAGFGFYLQAIADYGSIFGNLATLIVTLEYLYLTAIVFLAGLTVDSITEEDT